MSLLFIRAVQVLRLMLYTNVTFVYTYCTGFETDAVQECNALFQEKFSYALRDPVTNADTCGNGDEVWDACTDNTSMTFDYSKCPDIIAYSGTQILTSASYIFFQAIF